MQTQRTPIHRYSHFLLLASLFMAVGCSSNPKSHIGAFSQAAAQLAEETKRGYQIVNSGTYEGKVYDLASDTSLKINDPSQVQSMLAVKLKPEIDKRVGALDSIQSYAQALSDLSAAEFGRDMDRATRDLNGAMKGLNTNVQKLGGSHTISDKSIQLVATAVNAIGSTIQEKMRRKAIKEIVIQTNPAVQDLCAILKKEFPAMVQFANAGFQLAYTEIIKDYEKRKNQMPLEERVSAIRDIHNRIEASDRLNDYPPKLAQAADHLATAHAALYQAVMDDQFTTNELVSKIGEMAAFGKSIKQFNDSIATP